MTEALKNRYASKLGISLSKDKELRCEKKYVVVMEVITSEGRNFKANKTPMFDAKKAKEEVINSWNDKISEDAVVTFRCLEITSADVPVETPLSKSIEFQQILNRWLEPDELKSLFN